MLGEKTLFGSFVGCVFVCFFLWGFCFVLCVCFVFVDLFCLFLFCECARAGAYCC